MYFWAVGAESVADAVGSRVRPDTAWEALAGTTALWVVDVSQTDGRTQRPAA